MKILEPDIKAAKELFESTIKSRKIKDQILKLNQKAIKDF
jgi:hypothetical protein